MHHAKLILFQKISNFLPFILGGKITSEREEGRRQQEQKMGKRESPISECDTGVSVHGAFKLDLLEPVKLILSLKIFNFLSFIMGGPIPDYPQKEEGRK